MRDKTIVVTGGIGGAIVLAAAAEGANLVIEYVAHSEETTKLTEQIEKAGGRAVGIHADVSKSDDLHAMARKAVDSFGHLDVLVNNAGIENRTSLLDTSEADFEKIMAVNMKSAFFDSQARGETVHRQGGGGLVINIPSLHEDWPMPGTSPTASPKAASGCSPVPRASNSPSTASA